MPATNLINVDFRNLPEVRHAWADAWAVAVRYVRAMLKAGVVERIRIAGSLRRRKATVGDIELVFIPKLGPRTVPSGDLFTPSRVETVDLAHHWIAWEVEQGRLTKRRTKADRTIFGPANKYCHDVASGIDVDFFATTRENWANYLVCRTGGTETNLQITRAALARHWHWAPTENGFKTGPNPEDRRIVRREREVFDFVGLPYRKPHDRL